MYAGGGCHFTKCNETSNWKYLIALKEPINRTVGEKVYMVERVTALITK